MGPIRYGGYSPPRESFVRLKVGGEDEEPGVGPAGNAPMPVDVAQDEKLGKLSASFLEQAMSV